MSSLTRRIQRKILRKRPEYEPPQEQYRSLPDGGYLALHPTRGWKRFSAVRLRAIARYAAIRQKLEALRRA